ncbi:MAG: response regulator [Magnetococcales bacterium]|nr:response regulator [Magnetococcales bacterium]
MIHGVLSFFPLIIWSLTVFGLLTWAVVTVESSLPVAVAESAIKQTLLAIHLIIWAVGVGGLTYYRKLTNRHKSHLDQTIQTLQQNRASYAQESLEKSKLLEQLTETAEDLREKQSELERLSQTRAITNHLLDNTLEPQSLMEHLEESLLLITAIPWFSIEPKGAIFLWDDTTQKLLLAAENELPEPPLSQCAQIAEGHCFCGRAAQTGQIIYSEAMAGEPRALCHDKIQEQEHYCVPIKMANKLVGVLNLFVKKGHVRTPEEDIFLRVITCTLAGTIVRCQQNQQLLEAKQMAEQATRAKSTFLANMSHEIRSPMNAILGMGEVLAESPLNPEQQGHIQIINSAGEGLLALINDILDLSKIEADQLELETIPYSPKEIMDDTVAYFKPAGLKKKVGICYHLDEQLPQQLLGDPQRIRQVLLNLLSNAVKFTEQGSITLSATLSDKGMVCFSVVDTGIGLSKKRQEKIFLPFTQADSSTTRRYGGTGLGLSICKKLVEKMDGTIWVESQQDQGSTFFVEIPLQQVQTTTPSKPELTDQPAKQGQRPKAEQTILLADDAEENCRVIEAFLQNSPFQLTVVSDGLQALEQFKVGRFDLVLMDINMPVMDGYDATKKIRAWEKSKKMAPIPIFALTANAMKEDIEKAHQTGFTLHLSKPIRKKNLLEALKTHM